MFLYACEGSSFRPFRIFSSSIWPTGNMVGASNLEGSKARPFSYTFVTRAKIANKTYQQLVCCRFVFKITHLLDLDTCLESDAPSSEEKLGSSGTVTCTFACNFTSFEYKPLSPLSAEHPHGQKNGRKIHPSCQRNSPNFRQFLNS